MVCQGVSGKLMALPSLLMGLPLGTLAKLVP
jgi:hypothetical protein